MERFSLAQAKFVPNWANLRKMQKEETRSAFLYDVAENGTFFSGSGEICSKFRHVAETEHFSCPTHSRGPTSDLPLAIQRIFSPYARIWAPASSLAPLHF